MSKAYKKCANPDCDKLCKRHIRCRDCRRSSLYICQLCKSDMMNSKALLCPGCRHKVHLEYAKDYQTKYRLRKDVEKIINPLRNCTDSTITNENLSLTIQ